VSGSGSLLILRLSALGDILHTVPAVEALRESFPSRQIAWLVERPYEEFVELIAPVDRVFTVATKRWRQELFRRDTTRELSSAIRSTRSFARTGTAIDFQGLNKSAFLGFLSGATERYGFDTEAIREKSAVLWSNHRISVDVTRHVVEQNLELAAAVGGSPRGAAFSRIDRLPSDPTGALAQLIGRHPIVLNPGAGKDSKLWPVDRFTALAKRFRELTSQQPLVVWGPSERTMAEAIASGGDAVIAPPTSLRELAFLLKNARLVVAADTGPLHLAAAFSTPVIGLFGPTNPRRNGPYGQLDHCIETYTGKRTMDSITVDAVAKRGEEMLR
jgi:lipopolysaccharide heptosyltransferase I